MRQISLIASLAVIAGPLVALAASADNAVSQPVFTYPVRKSVLDNGLTVYSIPFDSPGIIAYYTVVRTGSRNEVEKGLSGFAHFFEHMMFRGTERYSQEKYNDVLKALGADSNAFTNDDMTCYHMTIPATALATAVEIESDRFQNLKYDEPSFQKEARAVLGEYNKSASSPFLRLSETMQDTAFTTHTYKHTTIGFLDDIRNMPNQYAYSKIFFDRWYRPENCTIVVVGDVAHDALLSFVKQYYGGWQQGKSRVEIPVEPRQSQAKSGAADLAATDAADSCGWAITFRPRTLPIPTRPLWGRLVESVFGEASPLYQELVLKEQKVVMIIAEAESKRDPGLFSILVRARKSDDLPIVRARIAAALAEAAKTPIDSARLDAIKSHLRYQFAGSLSTADAVALAFSEAISVTGRPESINELYDAYDRLAPADLKRAAARYFQPDNETMITLETEIKK